MNLRRWLVMLASCAALPWSVASGKEVRKMNSLQLNSSAFANGGAIPSRYTCDGDDSNPPLVIDRVPMGTKSLALIMDDPDAPVGLWVHWVVWNIPPQTRQIGEKSLPAGALQGRNSWGRTSYGGPCPPSGTHRYFFKLYALDTILTLGAGSTKTDLEKAMEGHVIGKGELMGTYKRR
ncbi:MAG: YbhB/YbcL family Raf kinase inhibitor-like protein [Geobacter sp.]|nr:MAG: YbhB/YbcL family Raf kinase inhibitor-like protein [Geobacter sp.]